MAILFLILLITNIYTPVDFQLSVYCTEAHS